MVNVKNKIFSIGFSIILIFSLSSGCYAEELGDPDPAGSDAGLLISDETLDDIVKAIRDASLEKLSDIDPQILNEQDTSMGVAAATLEALGDDIPLDTTPTGEPNTLATKTSASELVQIILLAKTMAETKYEIADMNATLDYIKENPEIEAMLPKEHKMQLEINNVEDIRAEIKSELKNKLSGSEPDVAHISRGAVDTANRLAARMNKIINGVKATLRKIFVKTTTLNVDKLKLVELNYSDNIVVSYDIKDGQVTQKSVYRTDKSGNMIEGSDLVITNPNVTMKDIVAQMNETSGSILDTDGTWSRLFKNKDTLTELSKSGDSITTELGRANLNSAVDRLLGNQTIDFPYKVNDLTTVDNITTVKYTYPDGKQFIYKFDHGSFRETNLIAYGPDGKELYSEPLTFKSQVATLQEVLEQSADAEVEISYLNSDGVKSTFSLGKDKVLKIDGNNVAYTDLPPKNAGPRSQQTVLHNSTVIKNLDKIMKNQVETLTIKMNNGMVKSYIIGDNDHIDFSQSTMPFDGKTQPIKKGQYLSSLNSKSLVAEYLLGKRSGGVADASITFDDGTTLIINNISGTGYDSISVAHRKAVDLHNSLVGEGVYNEIIDTFGMGEKSVTPSKSILKNSANQDNRTVNIPDSSGTQGTIVDPANGVNTLSGNPSPVAGANNQLDNNFSSGG
jgi:hypothetical protein